MDTKFISLIFFFVFSVIGYTRAQNNSLNNKSFIIETIEKETNGKVEKMPSDQLIFKKGKISTTFSKRNGFTDASYTTTIDSSKTPIVISFTSSPTSNIKKHTLIWSGTIINDKITGKAVRNRNNKSSCVYEFSGTLKK